MLSIVFVDVLGDLIACNPAENGMQLSDISNVQGFEFGLTGMLKCFCDPMQGTTWRRVRLSGSGLQLSSLSLKSALL